MKRFVKPSVFFIIFSSLFGIASANHYNGGLTIKELRVVGTKVMVGTQIQPPHTCNHYDEYFGFSLTDANAEAMYSTLLAAKLSGNPIGIWHTGSSVGSTSHAHGCSEANSLVLYGVALQ